MLTALRLHQKQLRACSDVWLLVMLSLTKCIGRKGVILFCSPLIEALQETVGWRLHWVAVPHVIRAPLVVRSLIISALQHPCAAHSPCCLAHPKRLCTCNAGYAPGRKVALPRAQGRPARAALGGRNQRPHRGLHVASMWPAACSARAARTRGGSRCTAGPAGRPAC